MDNSGLNLAVTPRNPRSLYDKDILLWVKDTVAKLKARDFDRLDVENLIEEVESLGISQHKELLSRLTRLFEHLLKRLYVSLPQDYNGWERTIRNQRSELGILLDKVPSLKSVWSANVQDAWQRAMTKVVEEYPQISFPNKWLYSSTIEDLLNQKFWECPLQD